MKTKLYKTRSEKQNSIIYGNPSEYIDFIKILENAKAYYKREDNGEKIYYINLPAAFDIETSNFYTEEGKKAATMWLWSFSIDGHATLGRTWEDFTNLIKNLESVLSLAHRLIVWVENLSFEFAFMKNHFSWHDTLCTGKNSILMALTEGGVEFRDVAVLSGKSLEEMGEEIGLPKLKGTIDYSLLRGTKTPVTLAEHKYSVRDVLIVDRWIAERIKRDGNITRIPCTLPGYTKKYMRKKCFSWKPTPEQREFYRTIHKLTIRPEEFEQLRRAFMGGFVHANKWAIGELFENCVDSFDECSAYIAAMCSESFPMSRAEHIDGKQYEEEDIIKLARENLLVFDVTFVNIRLKDNAPDAYIFEQKSLVKGYKKVNAERIEIAQILTTTITSVDYEVIKNLYDFDKVVFGKILSYKKGFLPKLIIEGILDLYELKTSLKGVVGQEKEYRLLKTQLLTVYGTMCEVPVRDTWKYNGKWIKQQKDIVDAIEEYNSSNLRFTYYAWAPFITAYARKNLLLGLKEFGGDYLYSDTDSIKCINADKHKRFIEIYNKCIQNKIENVLDYYGIDVLRACPMTADYVKKPLGVWEKETDKPYEAFCTLGPKKYMYTEGGEVYTVISGLSKKAGAAYLSSQNDPYSHFNEYLDIPEDSTGKLTHTYIGYRKGTFKDYMGITQEYEELSGLHLEPAAFSMNLDKEFALYLKGIKSCAK